MPMSELTTFFRHCPSCGRRFEIRLVGKKLVDEKRVAENAPFSTFSQRSPVYNDLLESVPLVVDVKEFQYAYRCKQCGHQWTEVR